MHGNVLAFLNFFMYPMPTLNIALHRANCSEHTCYGKHVTCILRVSEKVSFTTTLNGGHTG